MEREIMQTVEYFTNIGTKILFYADREDIRQDLYEKVLKLKDNFNPEKSSFKTYVSFKLGKELKEIQRQKARRWAKVKMCSYTDILDNSGLSDEYTPNHNLPKEFYTEDDYDTKIVLDSIEKYLEAQKGETNKKAFEVFKLMRSGFSMVKCSEVIGVGASRVSQIVSKYIKPVMIKAGLGGR